MRQTEFFVILGYFLPLHPTNDPENQNFWKTEKNTGRYYHFTYVYYKWQSFDVWFLRYGAQRTEFFVNPKNPNFEKITKKTPKKPSSSSFYTSVSKIRTTCYTVSEIQRVTDVIFIFHFGLFFAFLTLPIPPN